MPTKTQIWPCPARQTEVIDAIKHLDPDARTSLSNVQWVAGATKTPLPGGATLFIAPDGTWAVGRWSAATWWPISLFTGFEEDIPFLLKVYQAFGYQPSTNHAVQTGRHYERSGQYSYPASGPLVDGWDYVTSRGYEKNCEVLFVNHSTRQYRIHKIAEAFWYGGECSGHRVVWYK